jgi:hypothetical protein
MEPSGRNLSGHSVVCKTGSPTQSEPVTGAQIEEFRELARQIHDVRKSGLYFDPTAATLPREAVSCDEAATVIKLAESRLGMETGKRWVPAGSQQPRTFVASFVKLLA